MLRIKRALFLATLVLLAAVSAQATARKPFVDYWVGIYKGRVQVGCIHTTLSSDKLDGNEVLRRDERICTRIREGKDGSLEMDVRWSVLVDKDFAPITVHADVHSANVHDSPERKSEKTDTTADLRYGVDSFQVVVLEDGKKTEHSYAIENKINYIVDFGGRKMVVGSDISTSLVYALSGVVCHWSTSPSEWHVERRETVEANGSTFDAYALTRQDVKGTAWVTADGALVKAEYPSGHVTMLRQPLETATKWLASNGSNIGAVEVDKQIDDSRSLRALQIRLLGVPDKSIVISDDRQKATYDPAKHSAEYSITARAFDASKSLSLPVKAKQLAKWLSDSRGIEASAESIRDLAKEIVGSETDSYKAACRLRDWVNHNITYTDPTDVPKSAVAILKARKGVCTHYSVLYTALARAVGIPTKLAVGYVYGTWDGYGNFQMHTWAESYVGEWVAMEPTWGDEVVDPTHIKMFEGGEETAFDHYDVSGCMTAEIIATTPGVKASQQGKGHIIWASASDTIMENRITDNRSELSWYGGWGSGEVPSVIPPGSIVATASNGAQLIFSPATKVDSPGTPNYEFYHSTYPDGLVVVFPDGVTRVWPEGSRMEIVPPKAAL